MGIRYFKPHSNSMYKSRKGREIEVQRSMFRQHVPWYFSSKRVLRVHLLLRAAGSLCNHRIVEKMLLEDIWSGLLKTGLTLKLVHITHALSCQILNVSKDRDSTSPLSNLFQCLTTLIVTLFFPHKQV